MKFSYQWLNSFLEKKISINMMTEKLTLAGLEVDYIHEIKNPYSDIIIAEIKKIESYINNSYICYVDIGNKNFKILCKASNNIKQNMKVGLFTYQIKYITTTLFAILCSEKDLNISENNKIITFDNNAILGKPINNYLNLNDYIIDINITSNRADCLSIYGLAREISNFTNVKLNPLITTKAQETLNVKHKKNIEFINEEKNICPIYFYRTISNIHITTMTPIWIKERLHRSGYKSVSIIIDLINYIRLEIGQPIYIVDADKINNTIKIRMAHNDYDIDLLKQKIKIKKNQLVISDNKKVLEIAGIVNGLSSSIDKNTTNILIISAYFIPNNLMNMDIKKSDYSIDAAQRFELGVDPLLCKYTINYATDLIINLFGGIRNDLYESDSNNYFKKEKIVCLRLKKLNSILGTTFHTIQVKNILESLKFNIKHISNDTLYVITPSYRHDISIEEDLIEEIIRFYGYKKLYTSLPKVNFNTSKFSKETLKINRFKLSLIDQGYHEVINYSFIDPKLDKLFFKDKPGLVIKNPISQDMSVMRQSLIPNLLNNFKSNFNRKQSRIRIFEEGICFTPYKELAKESSCFSGLAYGTINKKNWHNDTMVDFFSVKNDLENLFKINNKIIKYIPCDNISWLHPGESSYIYEKKGTKTDIVGYIGRINPNIMHVLQIKAIAPIIFELNTKKISHNDDKLYFKEISKFPYISRDISIVVDHKISVEQLMNTIKKSKIRCLKQIYLFDIFKDKTLPKDMTSYSINLIFQDSQTTLKNQVIDEYINNILDILKYKYSAYLR